MDPEYLFNVHDYARAGRSRLAIDCRDYYEGGALDEVTIYEVALTPAQVQLIYANRGTGKWADGDVAIGVIGTQGNSFAVGDTFILTAADSALR